MSTYKKIIDDLIHYVDGASFYKQPVKLLYFLNGLFAFIPALFLVTFLFTDKFRIMLYVSNVWSKILLYLVILLCFVALVCLGLFGFYYWQKRRKDVDTFIQMGDKVMAIPVCAHIVRTFGEWSAITVFVAPLLVYLITYVVLIFSGFEPLGVESVGSFFGYLFGGLFFIPILMLLLFLIAYPIVFIARLISEQLMVRALVANNISDIGDIHRAALMSNEENEQPSL